MLTWQQFMEWAKQQVEAYNNRPHSSLSGRKTPAQRWEELARFTEVIKPEPEEVDDMFRPYVQRVVRRCELDVFNNRYFSRALEHLHGQEVRVGFDIHDVNKVWVRDLDGRAICTAELNGNRTDYFPVPVIEQAREKRFKARLKRVDVKRQEVIEEFHGVQPTVEAPAPMTEAQRTLHEQVVAELEAAPQANVIRLHKPAPKLPEPETREARFIRAMELERQIEAGRDVAVKEAMWLGGYKTTPEYHSLMELINDFGPEAVGMRA
jgi:putative transposase